MLTAYAPIVERLRPYVVATGDLQSRLDLEPLGVRVQSDACFDPMRVHSGPFLDLLQHLDVQTFGPLGMSMPRWALYDCGELPGFVFGFGAEPARLSARALSAMQVPQGYEGLVPLSMYMAIPMLGPGRWLGHSLCSLNEVSAGATPPGLRLMSMALGLRTLGATTVCGSTLWTSRKLSVMARFAPLHLQAAFLPAHSEPATCAFEFDVNQEVMQRALHPDGLPQQEPERWLSLHDTEQLQALQEELQDGVGWSVIGPPQVWGASVRAPLVRTEALR